MSILNFILLLITLNNKVFASEQEIILTEFDQSHLSSLISRLPKEFIDISNEVLEGPLKGERVYSSFNPHDLGIRINCWSDYYDRSVWPSFSGCKLNLDTDYPTVVTKNDQTKVEVRDYSTAIAFYDAIPYGRPNKVFFSFNKNTGTNFYGDERVNIFDFFFECSRELCDFYFSRTTHK